MSSAVGSFSGAVTSYKMGKEQKKLAYREASYIEREAGLIGEKRDEEIEAAAREAKEVISTARARYSKSGVILSEGSPAEVLMQMHADSTKELARMEYWKQQEQRGYAIKAWETRKAGRLAKKAGTMAAIGQGVQGTMSIASSVYGGISGGSFLGG